MEVELHVLNHNYIWSADPKNTVLQEKLPVPPFFSAATWRSSVSCHKVGMTKVCREINYLNTRVLR